MQIGNVKVKRLKRYWGVEIPERLRENPDSAKRYAERIAKREIERFSPEASARGEDIALFVGVILGSVIYNGLSRTNSPYNLGNVAFSFFTGLGLRFVYRETFFKLTRKDRDPISAELEDYNISLKRLNGQGRE